jgi:hypothetical protein
MPLSLISDTTPFPAHVKGGSTYCAGHGIAIIAVIAMTTTHVLVERLIVSLLERGPY